MKKKVFLMLPCIAAVAIAIVVGKKTYELHAYETNSLLMQNVEALSQKDEGNLKKYKCYNSVTSKDGCMVRYCPTCSYVPGTDPWYSLSSACYK